MRFLVDAQLPPALASWLVEQGHDAEHVADRGLQSASDRRIWDYAFANQACIVTKDEDFAQRRALVVSGPSVVWVRLPNVRRRELLVWFDKALPSILHAIARGEMLIEIT